MPLATPFKLSHWLDLYPSVIVPGLRNSDQNHWQTLWQSHLPQSRRIELAEWVTPDLEKWKEGIRHELESIQKPVILIAHSFGTLASAATAAEQPEKIAALFLAAPADPDKFGIRHLLPQENLGVSSKLIASSNDPWLSDDKAAYLALQWGSDFLRLKDVGHINSDSNLGLWPEGLRELQKLIRKAHKNNQKK